MTANCNVEDDDVIIINVGGIRHETKITTLLKKPETRLYSVAETAKACGKKEFYFDRNPQIFLCILNYYRIGQLHIPSDVCGPAIKAELDYWELEDKDIEECCWVNYISYEETMRMLEKFQHDDRDKFRAVYVSPDASLYAKIKPKLWRALQDPYSSRPALAYAIISLIIVLLSITVFVIETLPFFGSVYVHNSDPLRNITSVDLKQELEIFTDITPNDVLLLIDNFCNIFLFIEFVIKLITSPDKRKFIQSIFVISELLCLVPYYIGILVVLLHEEPVQFFTLIRVLFATRVLRIFRIFVLMKHFLALKILIYTIRASTKELFLLLIVLIIGVIIFGCIEYYMEIFSEYTSELRHIPLAFWWAIITMTTIGYGDVVPNSALGYAVGGLCAISGVLVIALSVPVIVNNFTVYYTHAQCREKLKLRRKKFEQTEKWQRLKRGLKTKLKKGTLKDVINGIKRRNDIKPYAAKSAPEISVLHTGNEHISALNIDPKTDNDDDQTISARDMYLEGITEADSIVTNTVDNTSSVTETNIDDLENEDVCETKEVDLSAGKTEVEHSMDKLQNGGTHNKMKRSDLSGNVFRAPNFLGKGNKCKKLDSCP